jgi:hypothetical protein
MRAAAAVRHDFHRGQLLFPEKYGVTKVTAACLTAQYLHPCRIDQRPGEEMELEMTKFYALVAALAVFAPFALTVLNQAAQI